MQKMQTMMTTDLNNTGSDEEEIDYGPSKSQVKRDCQHLLDVGEKILKLKAEERRSLELPVELEEAIDTALRIKSRSGLKRQRQYIGKLLRAMDSELIEARLNKIQHRHDTNTAQFKRLERWRDRLVENDKATLDEIIQRFPDIDRQHLNQLVRAARAEHEKGKTPVAARKLFKYLREVEEESAAKRRNEK